MQVIPDESQRAAERSSATFLKNAGIPTYIDDKHAIAHNKVMVIDGAKVITGSFDFTKAAEESNAGKPVVDLPLWDGPSSRLPSCGMLTVDDAGRQWARRKVRRRA